MKAKVILQFYGKTLPKPGKENYHYGALATDSDNINTDLATDFTNVDFWLKENLDVQAGCRYFATVNIQGDFIQFLELGKKVG